MVPSSMADEPPDQQLLLRACAELSRRLAAAELDDQAVIIRDGTPLPDTAEGSSG